MENRRKLILVYAGLVLVTVVAYLPVCTNGFANYDDNVYVTNNENVKNGFTGQSLFWAFTSNHAENWHPLAWLSHILDYQLFGLNPLGHHLTSVLLHIINTLLLFYILHKMTGAVWPGAFVACLFAIHPLHVESVAWVSERKDVLSALFWFLTILAYARYTQRPSIPRYAGALILFSLGLMAKPMLVTLPFALLLLDYWPLNRPVNSKHSILNLLFEKIPFFTLSAISSVITYNLQTKTDLDILSLGARISNALVSYISYIGKMIYPAGLAVFYPHPVGVMPAWKVILAAVLFAVVTTAAIFAARRRRYLLVGWLWYLGTLVPVIGIVQVGDQAMADRYTYLPSVGIFIIIAWSAAEVLGKIRTGKIVLTASSALILTVLLMCTRIQISYWQDSVTLFERAISVTKNNYKMHYALGYELISQGRLDEGITHYHRALEIAPTNAEIHFNLANTLRRQGKVGEAIEEYHLALQHKKDYADAHNNLGYVLLSQGNFDEAMAHFGEALKINPDLGPALTGLAQILATHPNPDLRDAELAINLARRAATLTNNQNATILDTLAVAYAATGRFDDAVTAGQTALNLALVENNPPLAAAIRKRLEIFREKKPYLATQYPTAEPPKLSTAQKQWAKPVELPGLPNFHKVSENLYRGAQPSAEGMKQLEKLGIKTVVNLRSFHSDSDELKDANLSYEHIYMKAWHAEDEDIVKFLKIVTDANRTPVFVHCQHGADRTGTMCAIYNIAVQGWSKDEAIEEMTKGDFGFHGIFENLVNYIRGLDVEKIKQDAGIKN
jgi:tetratricopeptide (TPR) repeat protein